VVGDGAFHVGHGKDVVVIHVILVAIVVVLDIGLPVVGRVDVQLAIEDVSAGIGCEEMGDDRAGVFLSRVGHICGCCKKSLVYLQQFLRAAAVLILIFTM